MPRFVVLPNFFGHDDIQTRPAAKDLVWECGIWNFHGVLGTAQRELVGDMLTSGRWARRLVGNGNAGNPRALEAPPFYHLSLAG
jgi:hypothetical protein